MMTHTLLRWLSKTFRDVRQESGRVVVMDVCYRYVIYTVVMDVCYRYVFCTVVMDVCYRYVFCTVVMDVCYRYVIYRGDYSSKTVPYIILYHVISSYM